MTYAFLDQTLTKCFGCNNCLIACKDEHVNNDWSPIAAPQPDLNAHWMEITEITRGSAISGSPKVKMNWIARPCMQCSNAPCITAATNGAVYRRSDGIVIIDPTLAIGQQQLVASCPYGAIYWNSTLSLPQKCTMCAHLIDAGRSTTRCMDACPTNAITFGNYSDLRPSIQATGAVPLHPEYGTQPMVFYVGLPGRFVAGTAFDNRTNLCLKGATVTLQNLTTGVTTTATTDNYGDFWFDGLPANTMFTVTVTMSGKLTRSMVAYTATDVDLGDIAMF